MNVCSHDFFDMLHKQGLIFLIWMVFPEPVKMPTLKFRMIHWIMHFRCIICVQMWQKIFLRYSYKIQYFEWFMPSEFEQSSSEFNEKNTSAGCTHKIIILGSLSHAGLTFPHRILWADLLALLIQFLYLYWQFYHHCECNPDWMVKHWSLCTNKYHQITNKNVSLFCFPWFWLMI